MTPEEIKDIRTRLGRTQKQFASILETTTMTVNRWENGRVYPMPVYLKRLEKLKAYVDAREGK